MGRSKSKSSSKDKARDRDKDTESSESKSADLKIKEMLKELHALVKDVQVRKDPFTPSESEKDQRTTANSEYLNTRLLVRDE